MSSRPQLNPHVVIENGSMAASITSDVTIIQKLSFVSYQVVFTGTPTGTFSVEVSNDYSINADGSVDNAGNWSAVTLTGSPVASGSSGNGFIDLDGISAYAVRLKYTRTSGSGTLNAVICAKVA